MRLPCRVRAINDNLQPFQSLVPSPLLDGYGRGFGRIRRGHGIDRYRQHLYQGTPFCPWRKRGARHQAIGPSRGGQTTKIHALTDTIGRPFAFELSAGNVADSTAAASLLNKVQGARYLLADKGYDANAIRANLRRNGIVPVIPGRINRKRKIVYDKRRNRDRHLIENAFCRIHTRYDKLARNFLSTVAIAILIAFWV